MFSNFKNLYNLFGGNDDLDYGQEGPEAKEPVKMAAPTDQPSDKAIGNPGVDPMTRSPRLIDTNLGNSQAAPEKFNLGITDQDNAQKSPFSLGANTDFGSSDIDNEEAAKKKMAMMGALKSFY